MPTEDDHKESAPTRVVSGAASAPTQPVYSSDPERSTITDASASSPAPTTGAAALIGTVINGRYAIESVLGQGGMGQVFLAKDLQLHARPVVVKDPTKILTC
jgi:hypothetical protein